MEDQGGAGGAPLHGHGDKERRRAPHVAPRTGAADQDRPAVRREDTDEASRLDRPDEAAGETTGRTGPAAAGRKDHRR
ncbi:MULTISPECIES: hypothetical protein [unclassified Streptomyces]|uniref:hypothetical protein n=1 Tax=unclassified Streptomyces TaxID=2593676 RepID=UPI002E0FB760|nr:MULTISPECIES: hypothetical protein [unclassified Streptomyces]WSR22872.1 hypothetical protein OG573_29585 [Streptomyces sp. NBC_01205]